ncbi:MAG: hypothetical protein AAF281_09050 [Pseudomonadota bacterium]
MDHAEIAEQKPLNRFIDSAQKMKGALPRPRRPRELATMIIAMGAARKTANTGAHPVAEKAAPADGAGFLIPCPNGLAMSPAAGMRSPQTPDASAPMPFLKVSGAAE